MLSLNHLYHPITATPFRDGQTYCEIAPCDALKPYIRCFWGSPIPYTKPDPRQTLVIPDTCMDIIFYIDYTRNRLHSCFCAIDEKAYQVQEQGSASHTATFAIRFYAWTAFLFVETGLENSKNKTFAVEEFFPTLHRELTPILFEVPSLTEKAAIAEKILLQHLQTDRMRPNLMNALHKMITTGGQAKISDIASHTATSPKQLERLFNRTMGIAPKSFASLLRYQLLWQDMMKNPNFNIQKAMDQYGYYDQSHLLNDFRKHHQYNPKQALMIAATNKIPR